MPDINQIPLPAAPPDGMQQILIPVDTRQEDFVLEAFGPFDSVAALSSWQRSQTAQSLFFRALSLITPEDYQRLLHYPLRVTKLPAGAQVLLMFARDPHPQVHLPHFAVGPFSNDSLWRWIDFGPRQDWRLLKLTAPQISASHAIEHRADAAALDSSLLTNKANLYLTDCAQGLLRQNAPALRR